MIPWVTVVSCLPLLSALISPGELFSVYFETVTIAGLSNKNKTTKSSITPGAKGWINNKNVSSAKGFHWTLRTVKLTRSYGTILSCKVGVKIFFTNICFWFLRKKSIPRILGRNVFWFYEKVMWEGVYIALFLGRLICLRSGLWRWPQRIFKIFTQVIGNCF